MQMYQHLLMCIVLHIGEFSILRLIIVFNEIYLLISPLVYLGMPLQLAMQL
jgi:hypothetical protein